MKIIPCRCLLAAFAFNFHEKVLKSKLDRQQIQKDGEAAHDVTDRQENAQIGMQTDKQAERWIDGKPNGRKYRVDGHQTDDWANILPS